MQSNKIMRALLVIASLLVLIGVLMTVWIFIQRKNQDIIKVQLSDGETEVIKFDALNLLPGDSCEYIIELKEEDFPQYNLSFDFVDVDEKKTLKNYARVKIIANEAVVYDELLATAFENDNIVLPVDLDTGKNAKLKIVYYLPLEVGNEAKNAEAVFEVLLTASNE